MSVDDRLGARKEELATAKREEKAITDKISGKNKELQDYESNLSDV
jgi:hypothetical protein